MTEPAGYLLHLARHRRGAILRALADTPAEAASDVALHAILADGPFRSSLAAVEEALRWLGERRLIDIDPAGEVVFARVTQRGADLVAGLESDPGVARLRPR